MISKAVVKILTCTKWRDGSFSYDKSRRPYMLISGKVVSRIKTLVCI